MSRQPLKAALLLVTLAAPLAACTAEDGPWPMPTGYYYENGRYHAAPGPQPVVKKIETEHLAGDNLAPVTASGTMTKTTTTDMTTETAAPAPSDIGTLVSRLFGDFGKPAEAVWVRPAVGTKASPVLAGKLRAALDAQGVKVVKAAGGGPFGVRYAMTAGDGGNAMVTLTLTSGGMKAAQASGPVALNNDSADVGSVAAPAFASAPTPMSPAPVSPAPAAAFSPAPVMVPMPLAGGDDLSSGMNAPPAAAYHSDVAPVGTIVPRPQE